MRILVDRRKQKRIPFIYMLAIGLIVLLGPDTPGVGVAFAQTTPDLSLIEEAWKTIQENYVDRPAVDPHTLVYGAISGMVDALGDTGHSTFLSPAMVKLQKNSVQGKFEGIGAEVQIKAGNLVIIAPIDGSPAQRAGLRSGDIILKVDGQNVSGLPLTQSVEKILGAAGTSVILTVLDPSVGSTREVRLIRASIVVHNVTWHALPGFDVALVRIAMFSKGVTKELKRVLKSVKRDGFHGMILDLRNNPGGLLDEAVGVASQFLRTGNVLLEKNAQGKITAVSVESGGVLFDLPLVSLINNGSASAAEIVAGALHDAGRARLVGEATFGTGTVLKQFSLSDGSVLLLAVQEWLTPDGNTIWHKGIDPDIRISLPRGASALLPSAMSELTREGLRKSDDEQLLRALDILEKTAQRDH
jgi:carboxyl-terminal processing protease